MSKKMLFTAIHILVLLLSGCVLYQGDNDYVKTKAFIETTSSTDKKVAVTDDETSQSKENNIANQRRDNDDSVPEESYYNIRREEVGAEEISVISQEEPDKKYLDSYVNPTISTDKIDITIDKIDHSVYSEGFLVGDFFYEKPHVQGNSIAAHRINDYFCKEYDCFISGSYMFPDNDSYVRISGFLEEFLGMYDAETITPFICNVVTKLMFLSEDYISFWQTYREGATGPRDTWNIGFTFSMKTGKLVSFTEFVDIEANAFKKSLCDVLLPLFIEYGPSQEDVYEVYGPNNDNTFIARYYDTEVALDKCYFYDGHSVFLTLNDGLYPHDGFIIKWDDIMHTPFTIWNDNSIIEFD